MSRSTKYYIGTDAVVVDLSVEPEDFPGKLYPEWQIRDEGDYLAVDLQGWD